MSVCVVLAGGLATRMLPLTREMPKSLVPVCGVPFVDHQLTLLSRQFDHVVLCIGHLGAQIRAHVGDGSRFGISVSYSDEGNARLGTAGALDVARDLLPETFVVTYGDSYLRGDLAGVLDALNGSPDLLAVMAVFQNHKAFGVSNVALSDDHDRVMSYAKDAGEGLTWIDYGAMAVRRDALPRGARDLSDVQARWASDGRLGAFVMLERFYEVGSPEGLRALEAELAKVSPA